MDTKHRFVIFSLDLVNKPATARETAKILEFLKSQGIGTKQVLGSYKGATERSILAIANDDIKLGLITETARSYNQESILIVNEDRTAHLLLLNSGVMEPLGRFDAISAEEATKLEAFTLDTSTMQYYAAQ